MDFQGFARQLIQNNPQIANNPNAKEMVDILISGDSKRGEQLAANLCKSYGIQPEQAVEQARKFFGLP